MSMRANTLLFTHGSLAWRAAGKLSLNFGELPTLEEFRIQSDLLATRSAHAGATREKGSVLVLVFKECICWDMLRHQLKTVKGCLHLRATETQPKLWKSRVFA